LPKAPEKARGQGATFIVVGVLAVVLLVVGVGGFVAYKLISGKSDNGSGAVSGTTSTQPPTNALTDVGRYWLEVEPSPRAETVRLSGTEPLKSGESFKFHFSSSNDGYVYIVGPGTENKPMAFLTDKPPRESGLSNNRISKGGELSFPSGAENWLTLDKNPGAETYTIILSPSSQGVPAFLNGEFTQKPLTDSEQKELADFVNKYNRNKAVTEVSKADSSSPFVGIKVPADAISNPVILEIRIQHQ